MFVADGAGVDGIDVEAGFCGGKKNARDPNTLFRVLSTDWCKFKMCCADSVSVSSFVVVLRLSPSFVVVLLASALKSGSLDCGCGLRWIKVD